jgi:hypothetical protein
MLRHAFASAVPKMIRRCTLVPFGPASHHRKHLTSGPSFRCSRITLPCCMSSFSLGLSYRIRGALDGTRASAFHSWPVTDKLGVEGVVSLSTLQKALQEGGGASRRLEEFCRSARILSLGRRSSAERGAWTHGHYTPGCASGSKSCGCPQIGRVLSRCTTY